MFWEIADTYVQVVRSWLQISHFPANTLRKSSVILRLYFCNLGKLISANVDAANVNLNYITNFDFGNKLAQLP